MLLVLLALPTVAVALLGSRPVQNVVAQQFRSTLSELLGHDLTYGRIALSNLNKITLNDLCLHDYRGDTLLFARHAIVRVRTVRLLQKRFAVQKILLDGAGIQFRMDSVLNLTPLVRQLTGRKDPARTRRTQLRLQDIELVDSRFSYTVAARDTSRKEGLDFTDLVLDSLHLHVTDLTPGDGGGVTMQVEQLSGLERSGLALQQLRGLLHIDSRHLALYDWELGFRETSLHGDTLAFSFPSFRHFGHGQFRDSVEMQIGIAAPSRLHLHELGWFAPYFLPDSFSMALSVRAKGTLSDLTLSNLHIQKDLHTKVDGRLHVRGLPDVRSAWIDAECSTLSVAMDFLRQIRTGSASGHMVLPESMTACTWVGYEGSFRGFTDDFTSEGLFTSNLGDIRSGLRICLPRERAAGRDTAFLFRGSVEVLDFDLGTLIGQPHFGRVSLQGQADGYTTPQGDLLSTLAGRITALRYHGYTYRDLDIDGLIHNKIYEGHLQVDEENVALDFSGTVDLTRQTPRLALSARVDHALLHNLHLVESDSSAFAAFRVSCDITGNGLNDVEGELNLSDLEYVHRGRRFSTSNLVLFTKTIRDAKRFILRSDVLNAELWGQYDFASLPQAFAAVFRPVMPALASGKQAHINLEDNNFEYEIEFRNSDWFAALFADDLHLAPSSTLKGVFNPGASSVSVLCHVPSAEFGEKYIHNLTADCQLDSARLRIDAQCDAVYASSKLTMNQFSGKSEWRQDTVRSTFTWDNHLARDQQSGDLSLQLAFRRTETGGLRLAFQPLGGASSRFTYNDQTFSLDFREVVHAGTVWQIDGLHVGNALQSIRVEGVMSDRESDVLTVEAEQVDMAFLSHIAAINRLDFEGSLSGRLRMASLRTVPQITSDFRIGQFGINRQPIGDLQVTSVWHEATRLLEADIQASRDSLPVIDAAGALAFDSRELDFDVRLKDIPFEAFHPYLQTVFSQVAGKIGGTLHVGGPLRSPVLNGTLDVAGAGFTVGYTQTAYTFRNNLPITNNILNFRNIGISDPYSNNAVINGSIAFPTWKDMQLSLELETRNLQVLNTSLNDNEVFYGRAFAGGKLGVKGSLSGIAMDIQMATTARSEISMPLSLSNDVSRTRFVTFVNPAAADRRTTRRSRQTAAAGPASDSPSTFALQMTLQVTPAAEIQLVFDSKIGDILRAKGNGTINMSVGSNSDFSMLGTYTIDEGDYLFTLQNVINKKFTLEQGGTVMFSGNPENASIGVRAKYRARPSLYDLTGDESQRRRTDADCILSISSSLLNPTIGFGIELPNASQEVRSYLQSITTLEDDMTNQFLSLLVLNSFYSDPSSSAHRESSTTSGLGSMGLTTASEFLSSQLSRMISGISKNMDIGVSYRPDTETGSQDVAFNLSTDVISLGGNMDVGNNRTEGEEDDNVLSNFYMEVRLNKRGNLLFKAFNRAKDSYLTDEAADYTQGIGLLYREDFNTWREMAPLRRKRSSLQPVSSDTTHD